MSNKIKKFLDFIKESYDNSKKRSLLESSLGRIYQHTKENTFGTITANRGELSSTENAARNAQLSSEIRAAGFGFIPVTGVYTENKGEATERKVEEKSFFVISAKNDGGKLKGHLLKWGKKYNQDSILYKDGDSEEAVLIGTTSGKWPGLGEVFKLGKFSLNKLADNFSKMKRNKTYTFESIKISVRPNVFSLWGMNKAGIETKEFF